MAVLYFYFLGGVPETPTNNIHKNFCCDAIKITFRLCRVGNYVKNNLEMESCKKFSS